MTHLRQMIRTRRQMKRQEIADRLWITYCILVMCIGGVLPIYTPNILICTCTYSTYCILLCTWNSHTIGLYEIRSLLKILCDPRGLAPNGSGVCSAVQNQGVGKRN